MFADRPADDRPASRSRALSNATRTRDALVNIASTRRELARYLAERADRASGTQADRYRSLAAAMRDSSERAQLLADRVAAEAQTLTLSPYGEQPCPDGGCPV
jgi:hypothetical protein